MPMKTPQDLFVHELSDIYDAEQRIVQMLPLMAQECNDPEVKSAFQQHEAETKQQITNIQQCFQTLGASPENAPCAAIAGLKQEHDSFLKERPTEDLVTMYDLGGAAKTEHYEIASYQCLIEKANLMGQQKVSRLLQQNLQQEEAMAKKVESISKQVDKRLLSDIR